MGLFLSKKDVEKIVEKVVREELASALTTIHTKLNKILMNTTELKAALDAATAKVTKIETEQTARFNAQSTIIGELTAEVQRLRDLIAAGGEVPAEVAASLSMLEMKLEAFDATIPDAPENPA